MLTEQPPPLRPKRPTVPPAVEHAVLVALQKLPADRFGTAKDFADALDGTGKGATYAATVHAPTPVVLAPLAPFAPRLARRRGTAPHRRGRRRLVHKRARRAQARPSPATASPSPRRSPPGMMALTPDAAQLVYVGPADSGQQLWVKERDQYEATPLAGTGGTSSPTVSPDGKWVAFVQKGQLKKIPITGGTATTLADSAFARRRHGVAGRRLSGLYHC